MGWSTVCHVGGHGMKADAVETAHGLKAWQFCSDCGLVVVVPDLFETD